MTNTPTKNENQTKLDNVTSANPNEQKRNNRNNDRKRNRRGDSKNERDSEWQERVRLLGLSMGLVEGEEKGIDLSDMIEFRWLPQISGKEDFEKFVSNEEDTE